MGAAHPIGAKRIVRGSHFYVLDTSTPYQPIIHHITPSVRVQKFDDRGDTDPYRLLIMVPDEEPNGTPGWAAPTVQNLVRQILPSGATPGTDLPIFTHNSLDTLPEELKKRVEIRGVKRVSRSERPRKKWRVSNPPPIINPNPNSDLGPGLEPKPTDTMDMEPEPPVVPPTDPTVTPFDGVSQNHIVPTGFMDLAPDTQYELIADMYMSSGGDLMTIRTFQNIMAAHVQKVRRKVLSQQSSDRSRKILPTDGTFQSLMEILHARGVVDLDVLTNESQPATMRQQIQDIFSDNGQTYFSIDSLHDPSSSNRTLDTYFWTVLAFFQMAFRLVSDYVDNNAVFFLRNIVAIEREVDGWTGNSNFFEEQLAARDASNNASNKLLQLALEQTISTSVTTLRAVFWYAESIMRPSVYRVLPREMWRNRGYRPKKFSNDNSYYNANTSTILGGVDFTVPQRPGTIVFGFTRPHPKSLRSSETPLSHSIGGDGDTNFSDSRERRLLSSFVILAARRIHQTVSMDYFSKSLLKYLQICKRAFKDLMEGIGIQTIKDISSALSNIRAGIKRENIQGMYRWYNHRIEKTFLKNQSIAHNLMRIAAEILWWDREKNPNKSLARFWDAFEAPLRGDPDAIYIQKIDFFRFLVASITLSLSTVPVTDFYLQNYEALPARAMYAPPLVADDGTPLGIRSQHH